MLTAEEQTLARRDPASVTNKELTAEVSGWLVRDVRNGGFRLEGGGGQAEQAHGCPRGRFPNRPLNFLTLCPLLSSGQRASCPEG